MSIKRARGSEIDHMSARTVWLLFAGVFLAMAAGFFAETAIIFLGAILP